jgi:hypothetical protein
MKRVVLIVMVAGLAACGANRNARHTEIHNAVSNTVFSNQSPGDGDAMLTIVREPGIFGGGCSNAVYLDDKVVANMETNDRLVLHVPSGNRKIGLLSHGACDRTRTDVDVSLNPGDNRAMQISNDGSTISAEGGESAAAAPAAEPAPAPAPAPAAPTQG